MKYFINKFYAISYQTCSSCKIERQSSYYQYNNQSYYLCLDCYSKKEYPSNYNESLFVKITPEETWSKAETHNLLEAVRLYNDNWQLVSKYVGKSVDECMNHFITLPIEDPYIQQINENEKPKEITVYIILLLLCSLNMF